MQISGRTRVFGILGYPVGHTLSPVMYNGLLEELGIDAVYVALEVHPDQLKTAMAALKALGGGGVHLTCPHKEEIIPLLDDVSARARAVGAVNVVVNRGGELFGDNTDGPGFLQSVVEETGYLPPGTTAGIIGAGGAARAIAGALAGERVERILIFNRTHARAVQVALELGARFPETKFKGLPLAAREFADWAAECDLVVNAARGVASGLLDLFPFERVRPGCVISDINYYASRSPFLGQAMVRKLPVHRGLGMLVHQGAQSLKLLMGLEITPAQLRGVLARSVPSGQIVG